MELLIFIITLLVLLLITNFISSFISFIPIALIQIAVGIIFNLAVQDFSIEVESEWFLLLFIAPLLYYDGAHFPRNQLWKLRLPILGNAIILVLLTTLVGGVFVHWLIPSIPLAAAFALMAILSPTDPVAVNGIAKRVQIPERIMNVVRGESLINDASGLVAFKYAVAAIVTGYFSIQLAIGDFLYTFFVGGIIGAIGAMLIFLLRFSIRKFPNIDVTFYVLIQLLTPFILYLVSEELFHASGVIAVVAGGILSAIFNEKTEHLVAQEQILTDNLWSILTFTLNGVIFLLLGLILPTATKTVFTSHEFPNDLLSLYVLVIGIAVLLIRLIWTMIFNQLDYRLFKNPEKVYFKDEVLTTLVGVRGTITMVGILSLPLAMNSGDSFPERQLLIFLAAGVILFTLIIATIFLPLLSEPTKDKDIKLVEEKRKMIHQAILSIRANMNDENAVAALQLIKQYNVMLLNVDRQQGEKNLQNQRLQALQMRKLGLQLEGFYTEKYLTEKNIDPSIRSELEYKFKEKMKGFNTNPFTILLKQFRSMIHQRNIDKLSPDMLHQIKIGESELNNYVTASIVEHMKNNPDISLDIANRLIIYYQHLQKAYQNEDQLDREQQIEDLSFIAIEAQRGLINDWYREGEITNEVARELKRFLISLESIILMEQEE
ncbi:sodium:proton antiporter [Lysinibacillus sp. 2017]|uniref:cation:proton antiporter n=1 Tax=unclassified Lysinibacillus TaxID=2636778 RepID=UPI000D528712|nr:MULTISPECIES: sodium:proton antiporter [unclassified Lysinibacillus]AWE07835.1 sodium:proton antiporter [Lysinibacillus sp. 2017]TGN32272.1 sodium:proton antiporter [Lysinibacillus sp. S2017]